MPTADFTAFYPSRPFWAVSKIDFDLPTSLTNFHDLMSEEVYQESREDFSIRICRDGMIMLRIAHLETNNITGERPTSIESLVSKWGEYLDYLNTLYLLLDSATLKVMNLAYFSLHEITNRDAFRVRYENGKSAGQNIATESISSVFQMARYRSSYGSIPVAQDPRITMRRVISREAIARAIEDFRLVMDNPGTERLLASFTKSISEYKVGNYETSIILAWFISEAAIASAWDGHISSLNRDLGAGQLRINRERNDHLKGRDFPISVVANVLELCSILPFDLFRDVDKVRKFRNKIVHGTPRYEPNAADAQLAIKTALQLFKRSSTIEFIPSLSYSVTGL